MTGPLESSDSPIPYTALDESSTSRPRGFQNEGVGESTSTNNDSNLMDLSYKSSLKWIHFSFFLLGLATLLPWSFFITADDYWKYKFRDVNANHSTVPSTNRTELQVFFQSYLSMSNNVPYVGVLILNTIWGHKVSHTVRNQGSLIGMLLLFGLTTLMVKVNTDSWQEGFFWLTMSSVVVLSSVAAFFQGSLMGIVSIFPPACLTSVVSGQAMAGLLATFASILSLAGHVDSQTAALLYFLFADLMLIAALIAYLFLRSTNFYKYHFSLHESQIQYSNGNDGRGAEGENSARTELSSLLQLFRLIWPHGLSIFLTFFVSLSLFPPLAILILPNDGVTSGWSGRYFLPLTVFLLYNAGDLSGRTLAGFVPLGIRRRISLFTLACLRLLFVPALLVCNLHKSGSLPRHIPILFPSVTAFISIMTLLGLTNGYIFGVAMLQGPKSVASELRERTGFILTAFLGTGLAAGSLASNLLLRLL